MYRRKTDAAPVHFSIGHDVIHELIFIINEKRRQTITIIKWYPLSISDGKGKHYRKQLTMNRSFTYIKFQEKWRKKNRKEKYSFNKEGLENHLSLCWQYCRPFPFNCVC